MENVITPTKEGKTKVQVTIHQQDLIKIVEIDEDEIPNSGDTSTNSEIRKFLLEQLEDEYKQVEIDVWIDGGVPKIISETEPDIKVSKSNGSYYIEP